MANLNDVNGMADSLVHQHGLLDNGLEAGDIDPADHHAIREHIAEQRSNDGYADSTVKTYLMNLRLAASRAQMPLTEMNCLDVVALKKTLQSPPYNIENGIDSYKRALRPFFRDYLGREWVDDCGALASINPRAGKHYDPQDALNESEIMTLIEAARDPRDRALIAFLAFTGARISLTCSLRIRDLDGLNGPEATFTPNPNGNANKRVPIQPYPLNKAVRYVRRFVNEGHPHHQDADNWLDAPLFPVKQGYNPAEPNTKALGPHGARNTLRRTARRTTIEKPVNPHNFRHSLVTRMMANGHDTTDLQTQFAWSPSTVEEMVEYYQGVEREDRLKRLWKNAGIALKDEEEDVVEPVVCYNCEIENPPGANVCYNCSANLSKKAERGDVISEYESALLADLIGAVAESMMFDGTGRTSAEIDSMFVDAADRVGAVLRGKYEPGLHSDFSEISSDELEFEEVRTEGESNLTEADPLTKLTQFLDENPDVKDRINGA